MVHVGPTTIYIHNISLFGDIVLLALTGDMYTYCVAAEIYFHELAIYIYIFVAMAAIFATWHDMVGWIFGKLVFSVTSDVSKFGQLVTLVIFPMNYHITSKVC